jgi:hypothetical protein
VSNNSYGMSGKRGSVMKRFRRRPPNNDQLAFARYRELLSRLECWRRRLKRYATGYRREESSSPKRRTINDVIVLGLRAKDRAGILE